MQVLTLIPIIYKLLAMSLKTILEFRLTLQHSFRAVLAYNLGFLLHLGKFSVLPNYLNFFIMDCTIVTSLKLSCNSFLTCWISGYVSQVNAKLFCLLLWVVNVRITTVPLYVPLMLFAGIITNIPLNKKSRRLQQ